MFKRRYLPPAKIEQLVTEGKLLRVLRPDLKNKIEHLARSNDQSASLLVQDGEHLYVSLEHIENQQQREQVYNSIQRYQISPQADLNTLPVELRQIIAPVNTMGRFFWGALIVGGIVGLIVGVLAMAVGMLFITMTEITLGTQFFEPVGMQITAIIFVLFAAFGWIVTAIFAWRKMKPSLNQEA